jgi:hypothetical protein
MFIVFRHNEPMNSVLPWTAQHETERMKMKDRRADCRRAVRMPLQYRMSGDTSCSAWKSAHTLDMSAGGVLLDIAEAVPAGSTLEVVIEWPGLYHGRSMVRLFVTGSVVRNDSRGPVLRILSHQFRGGHPSAIGSRRTEGNLAVAR